MKVRDYEKNELIIFISIFIFILELFFVIFTFKYKVYEYKMITGIISNKNLVTLIISKEEKKILNKNKKIYIDNKYLEYKIVEDRGYLTKKNNTKYYEVLIKVNTPKNKKENDTVNITIKDKKIILIKLLKNIWEGG